MGKSRDEMRRVGQRQRGATEGEKERNRQEGESEMKARRMEKKKRMRSKRAHSAFGFSFFVLYCRR